MRYLHLVSLGCTKNLVDSEVMLGKLKNYTLTEDPSIADVLIVNTCGFIGPAKEESLQTIFNLHEVRKKDSILVVSGCLTQRYKDELIKELPEVDIFTGVGDYDKIDEIITQKQNKFSNETFLINNQERIIIGSTHHAYIKLSEGCNQQCSFCAIPSFKGKLRSREIKDIVQEIKELSSKGFFDFTLISQDSSSYGRDLGLKDGLIDLIDAIEKIENIKSARILYLYPTTTSDSLVKRIIDSKVFHNYFDMPLQHISDSMLKIMKRGAMSKRIKELLTLMREAPNSFLRTGFIVGHPGETINDQKELIEFLKEFSFDRVTLFAYSDEEGTPAETMDNHVSQTLIEERLEELEKIVNSSYEKSLDALVGKEIEIVTLQDNSEHEFFIGAKALAWAPDIDGEILINDTKISEIKPEQQYIAYISERAGDKLLGTIIKAS